MSYFSLYNVKRWTAKKIFGLALVTSLIVGAPAAYAQDVCTTIVGNLLAPLNCGFDSGTAGWSGFSSAVGGAGALSTISSTVNSSSVSLVPGNYQVSFLARENLEGFPGSISSMKLLSLSDSVDVLTSPINNSGQTFIPYSYTVNVVNSGLYRIQFVGIAMFVDSFSIVAVPVPEPATMILLGSLCSAIVGYKYKRKQSIES